MKKTYETPKAEVVKFDYKDTVVASGTQTKNSATKCASCTPIQTKYATWFSSCWKG